MIDLDQVRFNDNKQNGQNTLHGLNDLIQENVKKDYIVVEIGCWRGVSSELIANYCKLLYCIDPWEPYEEQKDINEVLKAEKEFDERTKKYNVIKYKLKSEDAVSFFEDKSIDLIYIDGNHTYECVKKDIELWKPKIKNKGYICGHDYILKEVKTAVDEIFYDHNIKTYSDTSWCVQI
jgi:hypothetical protein